MSIRELWRFSDIDGVLKSANGTDYGLASGVFTNNISKALEVGESRIVGNIAADR